MAISKSQLYFLVVLFRCTNEELKRLILIILIVCPIPPFCQWLDTELWDRLFHNFTWNIGRLPAIFVKLGGVTPLTAPYFSPLDEQKWYVFAVSKLSITYVLKKSIYILTSRCVYCSGMVGYIYWWYILIVKFGIFKFLPELFDGWDHCIGNDGNIGKRSLTHVYFLDFRFKLVIIVDAICFVCRWRTFNQTCIRVALYIS